MNQILSIISDIRVVIGIAVVVLILAVWLIVEKVRTKKFRKELEGLEKRYNAIKSIPLTFKMNKAVTAARSNADTANKVNEAKKSYDMTQASIRKISENLANCEDAILLGKLRKADDTTPRPRPPATGCGHRNPRKPAPHTGRPMRAILS